MVSFIKANQGDIFTIQHLAHTIWYGHYPGIISTEQIEYMLSLMYSADIIAKEINCGILWYLIMIGDQPIGFISFHTESSQLIFKLEKLYILPSFHGKGYGKMALDFVKNISKETGAIKLYLRVNKQNAKAINSYLKSGFIKESEDIANIGNGFYMDDYIMSTKLN
jgi:RimJ/RimL family protein N-acetyltransferase